MPSLIQLEESRQTYKCLQDWFYGSIWLDSRSSCRNSESVDSKFPLLFLYLNKTSYYLWKQVYLTSSTFFKMRRWRQYSGSWKILSQQFYFNLPAAYFQTPPKLPSCFGSPDQWDEFWGQQHIRGELLRKPSIVWLSGSTLQRIRQGQV